MPCSGMVQLGSIRVERGGCGKRRGLIVTGARVTQKGWGGREGRRRRVLLKIP